jgi:hypothetical protein
MPKEGKITADEKERIIESYLSGKLGCCETDNRSE